MDIGFRCLGSCRILSCSHQPGNNLELGGGGCQHKVVVGEVWCARGEERLTKATTLVSGAVRAFVPLVAAITVGAYILQSVI